MAEAIATWLHDSNPVEQLHCGGLQGSPLIKGFHGQAPILGTLLPRGSSSESEHSVWRDGVSHGSLQAGNVAITPRDPQLQTERWSPISGSEGAARDVRHELDSVHDGLEHVAVSERLVSLPAGELRAAALGSLDAITRLARSQAFLLQARNAVDTWLAGSGAAVSEEDACRLRHLAAGMLVESHGTCSVPLPDGGKAEHSQATFVLSHALECPGFCGADGTVNPAFVTADLRCYADFQHSCGGDAPAVDRLSMGLDIEWQAQPLGSPGPPTVGAQSMPDFLVTTTSDPKQQAPDPERLARLQGLLGVQTVPSGTFLSFLLAVALAPQTTTGVRRESGSKRRRLSSDAAAPRAGLETWTRAAALLEVAL